MRDSDRSCLQNSAFFGMLSPLELDALGKVFSRQSFADGEVILQEGDPGDWLGFVVSGGVNIVKGPSSQFLSAQGSGGVFGEMALFSPNTLRTASCVAVGATECLILRRADLEDFCEQDTITGNKIYREMICILAERLSATSGDLAMLMKSQIMDQDRVSDLIAKMNGDT